MYNINIICNIIVNIMYLYMTIDRPNNQVTISNQQGDVSSHPET